MPFGLGYGACSDQDFGKKKQISILPQQSFQMWLALKYP